MNKIDRIHPSQDMSNDIKISQKIGVTREEAEAAVTCLLQYLGEDVSREGLLETPSRVVKALRELYSGYDGTPAEALDTTFEEIGGYNDIVLLRDITYFSHCEHHMLPFFGKAHIAYLPDNKVVGLSKLTRVVEIFAKRLQTQECLTAQIAQSVQHFLNPRGVAVMLEGEHMCMAMRGVQKHGTKTVTTYFTGQFEKEPAERQRYFDLLRCHS